VSASDVMMECASAADGRPAGVAERSGTVTLRS
jgi:hypothetical protein